jgi:hypothetical protein
MIDAHWLRLRYTAIETQLMNQMLADMEPTDYPLARLFDPSNPLSKQLDRVIRHREAAERSFHRAYQSLLKALKIRCQWEALHAQAAATKAPERTQSPPPMPSLPHVEKPENLALRL